jgi:hypothetical protein
VLDEWNCNDWYDHCLQTWLCLTHGIQAFTWKAITGWVCWTDGIELAGIQTLSVLDTWASIQALTCKAITINSMSQTQSGCDCLARSGYQSLQFHLSNMIALHMHPPTWNKTNTLTQRTSSWPITLWVVMSSQLTSTVLFRIVFVSSCLQNLLLTIPKVGTM